MKEGPRADDDQVSNQLYAAYAEGVNLRDLVAVVGEEALTDRDRSYLHFSDEFEKQFISQGPEEDRTIDDTLTLAWKLLNIVPKEELKRIDEKYIKKDYPEKLISIIRWIRSVDLRTFSSELGPFPHYRVRSGLSRSPAMRAMDVQAVSRIQGGPLKFGLECLTTEGTFDQSSYHTGSWYLSRYRFFLLWILLFRWFRDGGDKNGLLLYSNFIPCFWPMSRLNCHDRN